MADTAQSQNAAQETESSKTNKMRALSMPDLTELKDIQSFDEALFCDAESCEPDNDRSSAASLSSLLSPSSSAADLIALASRVVSRYYPMRVFSLGLNRSMSLPKERVDSEEELSAFVAATSQGEQNDDDDFYFMPLDEEGGACSNDDDKGSGYLPRFYSAEKLGSLIPPTVSNKTRLNTTSGSNQGSALNTQEQADNVKEKRKEQSSMDFGQIESVGTRSYGTRVGFSSKNTQSGQEKPPRPHSLESRHRDTALSILEDFFMGSTQEDEPTYPSPDSVTALQPRRAQRLAPGNKHDEKDPAPSDGLRSIGLEGGQKMTAFNSSNRRSIFSKKVKASCSSSEPLPTAMAIESKLPKQAQDAVDEKDFSMLRHYDRANSLPVKISSPQGMLSSSTSSPSLLPRRSSLKKVSSLRSIRDKVGENKSASSVGGIKPNVSFSNLSIREYEVQLGDNPSCSTGPPISLGWEYRDAAVVPLEEYETTRSLHYPRRDSSQLMLSYNVRRYLLLKTAGYTKAELRQAMKEVERIKRERKVTDMLMPACMLDEVMQDVVERVKSMFGNDLKRLEESSC